MTASFDPAAYSPARRLQDIRVYVDSVPLIEGNWRVYHSPNFIREPRLKVCSITLTSGAHPSTAALESVASDAGPVHQPGSLQEDIGLDAAGNISGLILRPKVCGMMDQVRIALAPNSSSPQEDETCIFLGIVTKIIPSYETDALAIECSDYRWLWEGTPIYGGTFKYPVQPDPAFLKRHLPVFNEKGRRNRYPGTVFFYSDLGSALSQYFSRGDVWNWLRWHYNTNVPVDTDAADVVNAGEPAVNSTAHYMIWPELSADGYGSGLFSAGGSDNVWPEFRIGSMELGKGLDHVIKIRGGHDYWLAPPQDIAEGRATLVLFGTALNTMVDRQRSVSFRRGAPAESLADARPEVVGGGAAWDADRTRLQILCLGAKKKFDLSFETTVGVATLAVGWSTAQQAAWVALSAFEKKKQYKNVFCRYVVPDTLDWVTAFGWPLNIMRDRLVSATLLSSDATTADAAGRPVRLRAQIWRYRNSAWEEMPKTYGGVTPLQDGLGLELPDAVRDKFWSWNGNLTTPTAYPIRITVAVEADERIYSDLRAANTYWPRREHLLIEEGCEGHYRAKAWMNATAGVPVLDGGAAAEFGYSVGYPETFRDDSAHLDFAAYQLKQQLGRCGREGPIILSGIRGDIVPGCFLEKVTGGGSRPDETFNVAIRRVVMEFSDKPKTTVFVEAD